MATTQDSTKKDADEFESANGDEHARTDQSDDEAFGLMPDEAPGTGEPTGPAATVSIDMDKAGEGKTSAPADAAGQDGAAPAGGAAAPANEEEPGAPAAPALDVEKETQRLRSWEGRVKAQQAELDREKATSAPGDAEKPQGDKEKGVDEGGDNEDDDSAETALAEDFGPEFVELLLKVIRKESKKCADKVAGEHAGPVRQDIDDIIAEIHGEKARAHFEKIADAHPDFVDVGNSDEFKAWVAALPQAEKEETERVATSGTAKEIIAMLKKYKASKADGESSMDAALDQAEGVRSTGGLKLPDSPTAAKDFESAWEKY